ncbi:DUF2388 domain-containing protein [Novilysobacter defluvii]|uniref:Holliday junction resolvase n=1 Tax=Lysobacter defluvii IMMIB APB-9 = DSM 18482 TaxID=1385515 RepID=A0A0A0M7J5_9GAMM|nr:DUF2388 domain-containing protein [Lysobacter defluvii]KGO99040.1 hypothetical protein N791_12275 [Lysobacter defluvii IMMIB APB-9 = DSM 18482]
MIRTRPVARARTLACAVLLGLCAPVAASSFYTTSDALSGSVGGTSNGISATSGSFSDDKVVLAARDDAASFVATDGQVRGARLEAALRHVRERLPAAREASDLELARAILTP